MELGVALRVAGLFGEGLDLRVEEEFEVEGDCPREGSNTRLASGKDDKDASSGFEPRRESLSR